MRETRPRNLKEMLVEAKNTSELMVDLSYTAIFYNSGDPLRGGIPPRGDA